MGPDDPVNEAWGECNAHGREVNRVEILLAAIDLALGELAAAPELSLLSESSRMLVADARSSMVLAYDRVLADLKRAREKAEDLARIAHELEANEAA